MDSCPDEQANRNLHAPWRIRYIKGLAQQPEGCFLCRCRDARGQDRPNLVLWRTARCLVVMNRFPYTGGHLLIAPRAHVADLTDLDADTLREMMELARDARVVLQAVVHAEGYNIGINLGRCAGAGLPGHLHLHVVPRWGGDTNFMDVLGGVRMIHQALPQLRRQLLAAAKKLGLPAGGTVTRTAGKNTGVRKTGGLKRRR